ncbi:LOW QUALITY PROTEIN: molybdopterin biosynthesis protein MoeA [Geomicrobium sp. JCM 19039]|nr:LOW QUALITY PROTEIN: molybdopterin biosynthesis protein MoeA [Geomicrobium sp. JCM 19039]
MVEIRKPIRIAEAVSKVMHYELSERVDHVPLLESDHRFLANTLVADHDVPPFDRSPYDGYAVRSTDTSTANRNEPITLSVVGEIGAGTVYPSKVQAGEAVRIMTGAKIPDGCDASCSLVNEINAEKISLVRPLLHNDNISFQGEDTRRDQSLVERGSYIHPGVTALLATFGYDVVPVARKPKIGILATGSELLDVHEPLSPGKIRNSNAYMAAAQVKRAGGEPVMFGKLPDDLDQCVTAVSEHLQEVDVMITTGGASVGDFDLVPAIIERLGADTLFNKVAMRPGSVTTAAAVEDKLMFGLSGNPGACYVGFEVFVRPLIRKALGTKFAHLQRSKGVLGVDFPKPNPFTRLVRGVIEESEGTHIVRPSGLDKSGSVISLGEADVFIVLPGGTRGYEKGMEVDLLFLENQKGSEWPWDNLVASYKS